jgi:hypothetical protein
MRDSSKSRYRKRIAITEESYFFIHRVKGKKSAAGKLEQIIQEYIKREEEMKAASNCAEGVGLSGKVFCDSFIGSENLNRLEGRTARRWGGN